MTAPKRPARKGRPAAKKKATAASKKKRPASPKKASPKKKAAPTTKAAPNRKAPSIAILARTKATLARQHVANRYGNALAAKASDALCGTLMFMGSPGPMVHGLVATPSLRALPPVTAILEFEPPTPGPAPMAHQRARREWLRDRFHRQVEGVRAELARHATQTPSRRGPADQVAMCWLNGTMRVAVPPERLAEMAGEPLLQRLDRPRLLVPEVDVTSPRVGAPAFRARFGTGGDHVTIAVIDYEVDARHPALAGRVVQKTNHTGEPWGRPALHGTAVAGIIAAADAAFAGVAPGVLIANYKVLAETSAQHADDFGGTMAIQQALEDGAKVANCSWGTAAKVGDGTSREAVACNTAWAMGLVLVKSAGNDGALSAPADADGIIVVGATDRPGTAVQSYSGRGVVGGKAQARPHLVAPGGDDLDQIRTCLLDGTFGSVGAGTSFAAAHVSGMAGLLLARSPELTPDEVRSQLLALCTPLPASSADEQGAGLPSLASVT